jgi:hypothetical protein
VKKLTILFMAFLVLFSSFSVVEGGIEIWPGKLTITMNEWYDKWVETKYNKIQVTNPYSYGINISVKLNYPGAQVISDGYSYIPDLSWIRVEPETIYLPPKSSNTFEVIIEVPKDEQLKYFNEKWETWAVFTSNLYPGRQGGMNFQVELAVKLFINTPKSESAGSQYLYIILFLISTIFMVLIILFFTKKRKNYKINGIKSDFSLFFFRRKQL